MRRPPLLTLALGALAVIVATAAVLLTGGEAAPTTAAERTITVARGVVQQTVSGSGTLAPRRQADVTFEGTGTIASVEVRKGEQVNAGDVLGRLDQASAQVNLAKAQADLQAARDALEEVTAAATTTTTAQGPPASTTPQTATTPEDARPQEEAQPQEEARPDQQEGAAMTEAAAAANVQSATLAVTEAQAALEDTVLRAPFAGTVAAVEGAVGDTPGEDPFVVLAQVDRFTMEVALSESDVNAVKKGQPATVTVNAAAGARFAAKVTDVGVLAASAEDGSTSAISYPVTLTLSQAGTKLKAGMSATADIVTAESRGLVVPNQALSGSSVTVAADGARETRRVQTGVAGDTATIVTSGLAAGDAVVVRSAAAQAGAAARQTGGATQDQPQQRTRGGFGGAGAGGAFPGGAAGPPGGGAGPPGGGTRPGG